MKLKKSIESKWTAEKDREVATDRRREYNTATDLYSLQFIPRNESTNCDVSESFNPMRNLQVKLLDALAESFAVQPESADLLLVIRQVVHDPYYGYLQTMQLLQTANCSRHALHVQQAVHSHMLAHQ